MAEATLHRISRVLSTAMRRGPAVRTRFAAVLDGRTLNLDVPVPAVAASAVVRAELRLVRGRVRHSVPARVRSAPDGSAALEGTALLTEHRHGLGLLPGAPWLVEAVLHTAGGVVSYDVLHGPGGEPAESPTVATLADPASGRRHELRTMRNGRLGVAVLAPAPTAEVTTVDVGWLGARIGVRLVGCSEPVTRLELTARSGAGRLTTPVVAAAGTLAGDLPLLEMAVLGGVAETFFDVHARTPDRRLRVGRFLHDVANPKQVLVPAAGIVWAAPGLSVGLRPYYTPAGSLTLACRPIGTLPSIGQS